MKKILSILAASAVIIPASMIPAQNHEGKIASIANKINHIACTQGNGWGGIHEGWIHQEKLDSIASNDDLYRLAKNHRQPAVRAISFWMLVNRRDDRCQELLYESLADTATFHMISADVGMQANVGSFAVDLLIYPESYSLPRGLHLTGPDSLRLDSTLIFTPDMGHIFYLHQLVRKLPPNEEFYGRFHDMYYREGLTDLLPILAKYRRDSEKQAIIEGLLEYAKGLDENNVRNGEPEGATNDALEAVAEWPCNEFWPALIRLRDYEINRKHFDYRRIRLFYAAVMAYDSQQAFELIDQTLSQVQGNVAKYHKELFQTAYVENSHKRFGPLIGKYHLG
uniref:hypothetical protein n=1 Tax=Alistipes communis TaxID=2585118 RepID=UPI003FD7221D